MKRIALKVDVDTFIGTLKGVPALLNLFRRLNIKATFLFSVGPDHTGRAIRRVFRKGFLGKVGRTSVLSHYGIRTLMNGVLLPGPHIGQRASHIMRLAAREGHEVGIHCYDHVLWQDFVAKKDRAWTEWQMNRAQIAFISALGGNPQTIGAAGWQLNHHVIELEEHLGFRYASDVRGRAPFLPTMDNNGSTCVQLPTTLPTLDEIIGIGDVTEENCWQTIAEYSEEALPDGHVFTLHAELEGMKLIGAFEQLLNQWTSAGTLLTTLQQLYNSLELSALPRQAIVWGEINGRSGPLAIQGP